MRIIYSFLREIPTFPRTDYTLVPPLRTPYILSFRQVPLTLHPMHPMHPKLLRQQIILQNSIAGTSHNGTTYKYEGEHL